MNYLRPDELASQAEIERLKKKDSAIKKGVGTAIGLGTAALGAGAASKIMPFLNEFIPVDLAIKGISKVNPKLGEFFKKGQKMGLDLKEGLNFIKEKINPEQEESQQTPPQQKNIISQYSDELNAFLENHINQGRQPLEAGALAQLDPKFQKIIKKMEQDHKTNFSSILQSTYGQQAQQPQMAQTQKTQGGIDPQLAQIMQSIRSSIQNLRGT